MAKYTVHGGHGYPGKGAIGVVGYINESIQARVVAEKVKEWLEVDGHQITNITVDVGSQNEILRTLAIKANSTPADLHVSIHFNASNGKASGTEVWVKNDQATDIAKRVCDRISTLGYKSRGVKNSNSLYILNNFKKPTILIECCFADNQSDFKKYDADKMAKAIAEGIVGHAIAKPHIATTAELVDIRSQWDGDLELQPVFRLYNPNNSAHFFTASVVESDILLQNLWTLEGIAWFAPVSGIPVWRLYNHHTGKHFFTFDKNECAFLVNAGWDFEGIAFYSDEKERVAVHRMYNDTLGTHHFTASEPESIQMLANGWYQEGIGWYAAKGGR